MSGSGREPKQVSREPARWPLLGLVGILIVSLAAGAAGYYRSLRDDQRREVQATLAAVAGLKSGQVAQWREERLSDARFLLQSPTVARDVARLAEHPTDEAARRAVLEWLVPIKGGSRYATIHILDRHGRSLLALPEDPTAVLPGGREIPAVDAAEGAMQALDFHRDAAGDSLHLALAVPVGPSDAGAGVVIVLRIDPAEYLAPLVRTWPVPTATAECLLVRRVGDEVEYLTPLRHRPATPDLLRLPLAGATVAAQALRAEPGVHEGRDYRGQKVVAATSRVAGTPWMVVAKIDQREAFAELRARTGAMLVAVGSLVVAIISVAALVGRSRRQALIAAREDAQRRAEAFERRLAAVLREANDVVLVLDAQGRIVEANHRAAEAYGVPRESLPGLALAAVAGLAPEAARRELDLLATGRLTEVEHHPRNGLVLELEGSGRWVRFGNDANLVVVLRDIAARKLAAAEMRRSNRLYAALLQANAAVAAAADRVSVGRAIGAALVEVGGLRAVRVSWRGAGRGWVREAAVGPDGPPGTGDAAVAPGAGGEPGAGVPEEADDGVVVGDVATDPRWADWRAAAGIRSVATVRLRDPASGEVGVLALGAEERGYFGPAVVALLRQLAFDLALALEVLAARQRLAASEGRHRALFENSRAIMLLVDPADGGIVDVNPAAERFYGWTRDRLRTMRITDINRLPAEEVRGLMRRAREAGRHMFHVPHARADGSVRLVVTYPSPVEVGGRPLLFSIVHDETERVEAERQLRASEERFRDLFDSHPVPMWVYDLETLRFLAVNDMALRRYGYTRDEFLGRTIADIRPEEDRERLRANVASEHGTVQESGLWVHRSRDGTEFRVMITSHAVTFADRPARLVLAQDVTERERALAAVVESEARLKLALQAAAQGIYDLDVRTGEAKVSAEYATMLGYDPAEFRETNAAWLERLHPDDVEKVGQVYRDYIAGRLPEYRIEFRQRTKDGRWKWILSLGRIVERAADGSPRRMLGTHTDITARVEAEASLRKTEARLRFALERSNTGGWDLDLADHSAVRTAEHDRIFGYDPMHPDWTYERFLEHVLPEDRERVDGTFQDAVRNHRDWSFECRIRRRDGAVRWIWAAGGYESEEGEVRRMAGLVQDITERKEAVAALEASERRFRALFEHSMYGLMLAQPDGAVLQANQEACRLLGRTEEEIRRLGRGGLVDPSDARITVLLAERVRTGRTRGELRMLRGDGTTFEAEIASSLFDTPEGPRTSLVIRDVSDRNRMLADLRFQADLAEVLLGLPVRAERSDEHGFLREVAAEIARLAGGGEGFLHHLGPATVSAAGGPLSAVEMATIRTQALGARSPLLVAGAPGVRPMVGVPVLVGEEVVMVAGVVRPAGDFTERDVVTVRLVADVAWRIVHQRRATTERENALRHLHAVFAASPVGLITYDHTGQGRSANAAAAALLGGSVGQISAQNFRSIPSWRQSGFLAAAEEALARRESRTVEARFTTTFGRDVWLAAQFVPFPHGADWHLLALLTDIAERMQATARLRVQAAALDAAANAIAITDAAGDIEWVNEAFCRNTGYTREELVGRNPRVLKSGRHPLAIYEEMWATILAGQVWRGEMRNRRKDGTEIDEDTTITPVPGPGGTISHFIAIKQDITERKRLEQQLLRSQRMEGIGLLAGGIAHDLNNILTPIQIGVDLLRKRANDPRTLRTLEVLESSARRGAGIVRQVLTFARGVSGERMPLRPRDVVREIVSILEETFPRQIEIRREIPADLPPVLGDPSQVHQVLLNLAVNARDAMPDGGQLVFGAAETEVAEGLTGTWGEARPGRYVVLSVADTGSGMPPEVLEHIFDPQPSHSG